MLLGCLETLSTSRCKLLTYVSGAGEAAPFEA